MHVNRYYIIQLKTNIQMSFLSNLTVSISAQYCQDLFLFMFTESVAVLIRKFGFNIICFQFTYLANSAFTCKHVQYVVYNHVISVESYHS